MNVELKTIDTANLILARKLTDFEYTAKQQNFTESEALAYFAKKGTDGEGIVDSHFRFASSLDRVKRYFGGDVPIIAGENLTKRIVKPGMDVLAFGGDDYFKYVSHFITDQLIVGINSDPVTSNGALLNFDSESFEQLIPSLENGGCSFEEWTRLAASIDGRKMPYPAISEIFIGSRDRLKSSRFSLELGDVNVRLSNSGLLVATGTGSTGWYRAAASCVHAESSPFTPTERRAEFYTAEAFFSRLAVDFPRNGVLEEGKELIITNRAHRAGVLSIDSLSNHILPRGAVARIAISDQPLKVAKIFF